MASDQISASDNSTLLSKTIASDQPSISQALTIHHFSDTILEPEYVDSELLRIRDEVMELIHLRNVPILSILYDEKWMELKKHTAGVLDIIRWKCLQVQEEVMKKYVDSINRPEESDNENSGPILLLANVPFFSESEYVTREVRIVRKLKKKFMATQEIADAKESVYQELKKKNETLEEVVAKQAEELKEQSKKIDFLMAQFTNLNKP